MPPKDAGEIKDVFYIDGKEIGEIEELTLPEIEYRERENCIGTINTR